MAAWRTKQLKREIGAPALAEPFWYDLVGRDQRTEDDRSDAELSPEGRRIQERKRRKQTQRANAVNAQRIHAQKAATIAALFVSAPQAA